MQGRSALFILLMLSISSGLIQNAHRIRLAFGVRNTYLEFMVKCVRTLENTHDVHINEQNFNLIE